MARVKTISFKESLEVDEVLRKAEELAKKDLWSFSELVYEALKEYVAKHYPGNPQTDICRYWREPSPQNELHFNHTPKEGMSCEWRGGLLCVEMGKRANWGRRCWRICDAWRSVK